ncbi:lactonase family protein [Bacillus sp. ISL-47]|uniref:lactonase family protein n=1 Tax=Bacillus sp. ISL-47 TaxID=2819130 RepID=UPI001BE6A8AA|nr:lactonase family protein [Bacillus sp. ISL-47]MBT2687470.1 lactonase family protein [Bacillus sp. ISL-47]MBT2711011.1 lactonase family protein [Pseudomonas sp. ISL-84]
MAKHIGFIGTYTKGESEGIYSFVLDMEAGKISAAKVAARLDNPTYLTISKDNQYLYSVAKEGEAGGVAAYRLDSSSGSLEKINSQVSAGSPPCHVSVDCEGRNVFSANYHKGTVESYLTEEDGSLGPAVSVMEHSGSGPDSRQEKPHTHYAGLTPDEKYVIAVDLGIDQVITYEVSDGVLKEQSSFSVKPGSGPRHLVFHPNGKYVYVMTEFSSEVLLLQYHEDGSFTQLQAISTLPEGFTENNQGSAIHISSDGRFVYAGNRGHDSIAVFSVNQDNGELSFVEHTSTKGNWPRDFVLDPSEKFVVATNQNSSNMVLYRRDEETGKLTLLQSDVAVPDPVCVKFLHV